MKQHITKEQWNDLAGYQKQELIELLNEDNDYFVIEFLTVGKMIEFLGDDLDSIEHKKEVNESWYRVCIGERMIDDHDELVDALWEEVKYKLK